MRWAAWAGVMALLVLAVCERVRLAMGAISIGVFTRRGTRYMVGMWDRVCRAMGSSRLRGIGLSGGFGMTTLGSGAGFFGMTTIGGGAGGLSSQGRRIVRRMGCGCARGAVVVVVQRWTPCCSALMTKR